jgi:dihydrofolate reductase
VVAALPTETPRADRAELRHDRHMGKIVTSAQMTLDGVLDQIETWFISAGEHEDHGYAEIMAADALLLGRETYEGLSTVWPKSEGLLADRINAMPKFVASTTLAGPLRWNATLLRNPVEAEVAELRTHTNLLSYGCGRLAYDLARAKLLDELQFYVHPTVLGNGVRIFAGKTVALKASGATFFPSGVTLLSYRLPR